RDEDFESRCELKLSEALARERLRLCRRRVLDTETRAQAELPEQIGTFVVVTVIEPLAEMEERRSCHRSENDFIAVARCARHLSQAESDWLLVGDAEAHRSGPARDVLRDV